MPYSNHMRASGSHGYSKEELQKLLSHEHGTARRQELLKAIWRLSQQRGDVDSNNTAKSAAACSGIKREPSSQNSENLSISC